MRGLGDRNRKEWSLAGTSAKVFTMSTLLIGTDRRVKPVVYACIGHSNVARLAKDIAIILDRDSIAELSSTVGLRANYLPIVHKACTADCIIAIDGCTRNCTLNALARHSLIPTHHVQLQQLPIQKRENQTCTLSESYHALCHVYEVLGVVSMTLKDWRFRDRQALYKG